MKAFLFLKELYQKRNIIFRLAANDLKERYSGSLLGLMWAILQPLFTICVMWFVFSFGFRTVPIDGVPFILWLSCGMIPWFFLSEGLISMGNAILDKSFLVKKMVFPIAWLPIIKLLSLLFVHVFFIFVLLFLFAVYGRYPSPIYMQLFYYAFAAAAFLLAISYVTASIVVFSRDFGQLIAISVQFLFWATPIFWQLSLIPERYRWIFRLNPLWYITNGYRDTLIDGIYVWQRPTETALFWTATLAAACAGVWLFQKLRPHFADVL